MKTAIVTDGKYRSSIAAVRALHRAGYQVIVTQTRADVHTVPAVASSRCCAAFRWIDGAAADDGYADRLAAMLETYDHPVLFCVGAVTLNTVAAQRERFARIADFLIAPRPVLDALNDKETVHARAQSLGIPVPRQYDGVPPERYPVVIKPHCGGTSGSRPPTATPSPTRRRRMRRSSRACSAMIRRPSCRTRSPARASA